MTQSKDIEWLNGYTIKTHIYGVKRVCKTYFKSNETQRLKVIAW